MKKSVIYGAGNIGRGFIGQLFSESGYEVVFIDINQELIDRLNKDRKYPIQVLSRKQSREFFVENVRAVNGNSEEQAAGEIASASIMATSIGANVLPKISRTIAAGLKKRWKEGNREFFNIIICENLLDANKLLYQYVEHELEPSERELLNEWVGFVEASVGRMVPVMTEQMLQGNIAKICVEEFCELPVDKDGFKGPIPDIKYMVPFSPFMFYIQRKLYIHNMGHALAAYLGKLKGYTYIWQAIGDPNIRLIVMKAMQDSAIALAREHKVPLDKILVHIDDLIYRFSNKLLEDTINRVGRDVKRKLSEGDRLFGAARLCLKHGILPSNICLGIAAALHFNPSSEISICYDGDKQKLFRLIEEICHIQKGDPLLDIIVDYYIKISNGYDINQLIENAIDFYQIKAVG